VLSLSLSLSLSEYREERKCIAYQYPHVNGFHHSSTPPGPSHTRGNKKELKKERAL
jgi:hypothetical protein